MFETIKKLLCLGEYTTERTLGVARSGKWPAVREAHMAKFPNCAVCDTDESCEAHHVKVFYKNPSEELNPNNIITLCRQHHLEFGHLGSFKSFNKNVREDAETWNKKIKNRP